MLSSVARHSALFGQAARFGLVGIVNTIFGLSIIFLLLATTSIGSVLANAVGFACGLLLSFILNARWTFRSDRAWGWDAFARFLFGFAIAYGINVALLIYLTESLALSAYLANGAGITAYAITFFAISRSFAFKKRP